MSAHSETPIASAQELDELTRLRAELSYLDWKAHPRHRTERVLREAQRQWGVPEREALFWSGLLPSGDDTRDTATTCAPARVECDGGHGSAAGAARGVGRQGVVGGVAEEFT